MGFCGYISKDERKININKMSSALFNSEKNSFLYYENFVIAGDDILETDEYIAGFYGRLNNRTELIESYGLDGKTDLSIILELYSIYSKKTLEMLDGNYSFIIFSKEDNSALLVRDRLGVKPIYYTLQDNELIFSTRIKCILEYENVTPTIGKYEVYELLGLGPAHTPGRTFFKNIYEIPAGNFAYLLNTSLSLTSYWNLHTNICADNIYTCINNTKNIVTELLEKDFEDRKDICTMLSGGLDSSVLTYLASKRENNSLSTFSINFENNDNDFKANEYQPTKDSDFVKIMSNYLDTSHTNLTFSNKELFDALREVVICRDSPGMGDVDSSMYVFCKKIKEQGYNIAISGECSDEIFGGYPWYYKEHLLGYNGFPWSKAIDTRKNILNGNIFSKEDFVSYVNNAYLNTINKVGFEDEENENKFRGTCYLTIKWFMNTLIERTERISSSLGLDVRTPFASYKLFEYIYNIPSKYKLGLINDNNIPIEKYLLRKAFEDELPKDIVYRKKSPFPKTYDPEYTKMLENEIGKIITSSTDPLLEIIDVKYLFEMLDAKGGNMKENWFGQLMTYPQTLSYLIQINIWLKEYNVKIDI